MTKLSLGQYQAQIERLPTYAERKTAVEKAPEHMREQIIAHLRTVRVLKGMGKLICSRWFALT